MWTITVLFGGGGSVNLIFEGEAKAKALYKKLHADRNPSEDTYEPQVVVEDDFGTHAVLDIAEVICHTLQDVKRVQAGSGELNLLAAKANMAMQQKASRDPALALMMGRQPGGLMT